MKWASKIRAQGTKLLALSALTSCGMVQARPTISMPLAPSSSPGLEARVALGEKTVGILQGATHVQIFRLLNGNRRTIFQSEAQRQSAAPVPQGGFGEYMTIDHAGPDQGRAFVAQANRALFDNELYDPGGLVKCFDPGVGLRFWKGKERIDVALCFECGQLSVTTFDAVGKHIHEIHQLAMGFDQPLFVRLIQPVFRRDAEIQALKPYALPADIATPEARAAQENDIREAIFRHLMTEQGLPRDTNQSVRFLSIGPTDQAPADPDTALLRRFASTTPSVRPVSAHRPGSAPIAAVFLRVAHLRWIEPNTVYAEAAYFTESGAGKAFTYGLEKTHGRWAVTVDTPQGGEQAPLPGPN